MSRKSKGARSRQKPRNRINISLPIVAALLLGLGATWLLTRSGEASSTKPEAPSTGTEIQLAPASQLPAKVRSAPLVVQEAYRIAIANPDILTKFPCYCGCGNMGHMNNLDCFIKDLNPDGSIVFDYHALGWSICVDIARDVKRMTEQGKPLTEIRTYVDREYSKFGPPTDTDPLD